MRSIHIDLQPWVHRLELKKGRTHGEHATAHGGAASLDVGIAFEHLGVVLHHAACDVAVLLMSQRTEVAPVPLCVVYDVGQQLAEVESQLGEFLRLVSLLQDTKRGKISLAATHIARTVTTIVADIEWMLSGRWRCLWGSDGVRIEPIIGGSKVAVGLNLVEDCLCPCGGTADDEYSEQDKRLTGGLPTSHTHLAFEGNTGGNRSIRSKDSDPQAAEG